MNKKDCSLALELYSIKKNLLLPVNICSRDIFLYSCHLYRFTGATRWQVHAGEEVMVLKLNANPHLTLYL